MTSSNYERWTELADRAAIGETLSAGDQDFLCEYAAGDPVAGAEAALWEAMGDLDATESAALDDALAERAVRMARSAVRPASSRRRSIVWAVGGALAAAAAVAALVSSKSSPLVRAARGLSVVEYLVGEALADGARVEKLEHLAVGSVVEAVTGPVCVAVEPRIHACLTSGAKIKLSLVGAKERRVDLLSGRVAIALDPLPRGERFSVVAGGVWSTAVGTAFTVEIEPDGSVQTIVHEGKVAVGPATGGGSVVGAHKIGLSHGEDVTVVPLGDHTRTETPDWIALASVANRSIEAPAAPEVPAAAEVAPKAATPSAPEMPPAAVELRVASREAPITKVAAPPAADLLALARQSLRDKRWTDAAKAYRQLIAAYPSSPEARTVVVPLAKLEIDRLGQPAAALPSLDAYIASGATLVVEARSARIRAYRALGRQADELRAIDEFLAAHPSSVEATQLRERADSLRGH